MRDDPSSTGASSVALIWCGPSEHGIVRLARQVAKAAVDLGFTGPVMSTADPRELLDVAGRLPAHLSIAHLHLNDWLFADAGVDVVEIVDQVRSHLQANGIRLAVTLHDLPQVGDGDSLFARRAETYRRIVSSADTIAVCSEYEKQLLEAVLGSRPTVQAHVIPLPVDVVPWSSSVGAPADGKPITVGIFGFLYPGKGHREVIDALAGRAGPAGRGGLDRPVVVVAAGRASDRHTGLVAELTADAAQASVGFYCTGFVADEDLPALLGGLDVPVAPQTKISASASINSWIAAGRRPLVPRSPYVTELQARLPGAVWIYEPGQLAACIEQAVIEPELTRLPSDFAVGPGAAEVAQQSLAWLVRSGRPAR